MSTTRNICRTFFLVLLLLPAAACSTAQKMLDSAGRGAERAAARETAQAADRAVSSGADAVEGAVMGNGAPSSADGSVGGAVGGTVGSDSPTDAAPGEGAWANYDFVPGERVLFADDFSDDVVGDFPRRLEWVRGNMEVVEWEGRRLLRATGENSQFAVLLPAGVPERFTIEFDIHDPVSGQGTGVLTTAAPKGGWPQGAHFNYGNWRGSGFWIGKDPASTVDDLRIREQIVSARTMVDGAYAKAYINEKRVANVPRAELERGDRITFVMWARGDAPVYIGDIRIAEGGKDLYDDLAEKGRVSTQGILFGVNSSNIEPESTPTLAEIGTMLQQHADLRLSIEGHTDASGSDAYNLELSQKRADAVRAYLVREYGVDSARLQAVGKGETVPMDTNDTPEGRQNNRRVELVRLG